MEAYQREPATLFDLQANLGALARLPVAALEPARRDCIVYAYVDGCSHGEIAERTNTPLGTVKAWIKRGMASLQGVHGMTPHRRRPGRAAWDTTASWPPNTCWVRCRPARRREVERRLAERRLHCAPKWPSGRSGSCHLLPWPNQVEPSRRTLAAHRTHSIAPAPERRARARQRTQERAWRCGQWQAGNQRIGRGGGTTWRCGAAWPAAALPWPPCWRAMLVLRPAQIILG
jgi:hypothetical protein